MSDRSARTEDVPREADLISQYRTIGPAAVLAAALAASGKRTESEPKQKPSILH